MTVQSVLLLVAVVVIVTVSTLLALTVFWPASTPGERSVEGFKARDQFRVTRIQAIGVLAQSVAGAGLLFGVYFTAATVKNDTERTTRTLQQSLDIEVTSRFKEANAMLGSDQVEVRVGAAYALERIARDSEKDRVPILNLLAAFVKHRSHEAGIVIENCEDRSRGDLREDIQAAVLVFARLWPYQASDDRGLTPDRLQRPSLNDAVLNDAHLGGVGLQAVNLYRSNLRCADLRNAHLEGSAPIGAEFDHSDLRGAVLTGAVLSGASFDSARMENADLRGTLLTKSGSKNVVLRAADLTNASLVGADLTGADLRNANVTGANFRDSRLARADLRLLDLQNARGLTPAQVLEANFDPSTKLPPFADSDDLAALGQIGDRMASLPSVTS